MSFEKLLESVADAVSAMVIFSNDAGSNSAVLRNLAAGSQAVSGAVLGFVNEARGTVTLWNELGSLECANQMDEACDSLANSINQITTACQDIIKDPHDNVAKAALLDAGKDVMKSMVAILQFNDLYGVMVILNQIVVAQTLVEKAEEDHFSAEDFGDLIRTIVGGIESRFEVIHDIKVKQQLEEAKGEVEKLGIGLSTIVVRALQDARIKQKIPVIVPPLLQALQKATKAVKLSAKSPFDLNMMETEFQYHDDEFIDEITVTTSDFHQSLNAVKKAVKSGDEFELERAIRAIEADLKAEIAAAEEIAEETSDPQLRAQMMAKIKQAKAEMGNLMQKMQGGTEQALLTADFSSMEPLLEGAYKMFGGLFEGTAVKELLMAGDSIDALFNDLVVSVDGNDKLESIALTKDIARELERQKVYAHSLADIVNDEYRKQRILGSVDDLLNLCADLPTITMEALDRVPGARDRLEALKIDAQAIETDLLLAATNTTEDELLDGGIKITQALSALSPLMQCPLQNKDLIASGLTELLNQIKHQSNVASSWAATIKDDPALVDNITGFSQQLKAAAAPLAICVKKVLATPGSGPEYEQARREYLEAVNKFTHVSQSLVSSVIQSPDAELEGLQSKMSNSLHKLQEAMASKDVQAIAIAIAELKKDTKGMTYVAELLSGDIDDPDLQRLLLSTSNSLAGKLDSLLNASKTAIKNPKDQKSKNDLDDLLKDFETTLGSVINYSDSASPEDQITGNANSINKLAKKFVREVETAPSQSKSLEMLEKKVVKQKQLASVVSKRCDFDPSLGQKLLDETEKFDNIFTAVKKMSGELVKTKPDKKVIANIQNTTNQLCDQSTLIGHLAQNVKTGKKEAEEKAKEEARLEEERAKQQLAEKQKAVELAVPIGIKEVWIDAQELKTLIQDTQLLNDSSPVGSLAGIADSLAKSVQELAALSKNGTKNQIITSARQIATMVDKIGEHIAEVSKNCRDPILNREMTDMGHVAKNFSVQLKILCGVKAGLLLDDDKETAQSLIICSKGLCKTVGDIVNRTQIAKLKPITGAHPPPKRK